MKRSILTNALVLVLLAVGLVGCDMFEETFGDEQEVTGIVDAVGDNSLTVDGIDYRVTADTEFEGTLETLSDLTVGEEVEVEYEEDAAQRVALEIERTADDDEDDGFLGL